jgi:DNA-binding response OmpR family regulator
MATPRKPRLLIFDDDTSILNVLEKFFSLKGYEVFSFAEPEICPIYRGDGENCAKLKPCADLIITDFCMPGMNGAELLERQGRDGCRLDIRNKTIISGYIPDDEQERVDSLGCAVFRKPFRLSELSPWLKACEERMDLSKPVGMMRRESRHATEEQIMYHCGDRNRPLRGTVINMSDSGLCLKVDSPLPGSQTIKINTGLANCCQSGNVRWVRESGNNVFMVGLTCS